MSYETIQASGQVVYTSNHGGSFEDKLIDLTTGNSFVIIADGNNATIRNIGFEGLYRGGGFMISITGSGQIDIENIYLGDGCSQEGEDFVHGPGAIFYHRDSNADVNFRRCCVRGYSNNGFYCSNSASGGSISWENCYTVNCGVTHYRGADPGDEMHDCVGYNTADERYGQSSGSERFGRIVWAWEPGPIDIYDSHIDQGPASLAAIWSEANNDASQVNMHSGGFSGETFEGSGSVNIDSSVSSSPDLTPPPGVPMSAEQAASGESGPQDDPAELGITTGSAENVTSSSARLTGEITGLGDNDEVDVYFEYRESGPSSEHPDS